METLWTIVLIAIGIIVFIGLIRIILTPRNTFWEGFCDLFLIDLIVEFFAAILEHIDFD